MYFWNACPSSPRQYIFTIWLNSFNKYLKIFWSSFQYISNKTQRYTVYFIWKLLYMFRVVPSPIIRSANNCIYSIQYLSHRYCYLLLSWKSWSWFECAVGGVTATCPKKRQVAVTVWQIPDAVGTGVCAPHDGWKYHPKHVEQFPDKINRVTLHLAGYILEYSYDARTHERSIPKFLLCNRHS
jgi:hypothetical protein